MTIDRPGQAYAADITYIRMAHGAMYLTAMIDGHSRKALSHRVSNTMDGKGRWIDNVYVERFWRSLKVEEINLHAYASPGARAHRRLHPLLQRRTPAPGP